MMSFNQQVDAIAADLVMLDADDDASLQRLSQLFAALTDDLSETENGASAAISRTCLTLFDDSTNPEKSIEEKLEVVTCGVQTLQSLLGNESQPPQTELPESWLAALRESGMEPTGCAKLDILDSELVEAFLNEMQTQLETAEQQLLTLESEPQNQVSVDTVFRAFHTIKGFAAFIGCAHVSLAARDIETLLDQLRGGTRHFDAELSNALLRSVDMLRSQTECIRNAAPDLVGIAPDDQWQELQTTLRTVLENETAEGDSELVTEETVELTDPPQDAEQTPQVFDDVQIAADDLSMFSADPEMLAVFVSEATEHLETAEPNLLALENDPSEKEALDAVFRSFHSIKGTAGFMELHQISKLAHEAENMLDRARDGELTLSGDAMDLALESVDLLRANVECIRESSESGQPPKPVDGMQQLIEKLQCVTAGKPLPTATPTSPAPTTSEPESKSEQENTQTKIPAAKSDDQPKKSATAKSNTKAAASSEAIKVDRGRLDGLIDLIGELVIAESMVYAESATKQENVEDSQSVRQLRKITRELQELSLSLRMVPINGLFQKMARLVRDLSKKMGKSVDFQMEGAETELDKTVVDLVADPLVHIVRNSLDHGIEPDLNDRIAAGKSEQATVTIRAFYQGGNIYIEVQDDGRGLNRDRLLAKAKEKGLVSEGQHLTDHEIHNLIFAPGFSTAQQVTDVSGRGVGMDVVRRNIETLRGNVEVHSKEGVGTRISLRLPLTLAIIDGVVVQVGTNRYIIPTLSIVEQIKPQTSDLAKVGRHGELLAVRGKNVPFYRLNRLFDTGTTDRDPTEGIIVLVEFKDQLAGLLVDDIIGQQQVVIKSLGTALEGLTGLAGGAILPDGQVGVILDVHGVLQLAQTK